MSPEPRHLPQIAGPTHARPPFCFSAGMRVYPGRLPGVHLEADVLAATASLGGEEVPFDQVCAWLQRYEAGGG